MNRHSGRAGPTVPPTRLSNFETGGVCCLPRRLLAGAPGRAAGLGVPAFTAGAVSNSLGMRRCFKAKREQAMSDRASEHEHPAASALEASSDHRNGTAAPFSGGIVAALAGLQRTAGNRAVAGLLLQRQGAGAATARGPAVGEAVRPEVEGLLKAFAAASGFEQRNALAVRAVWTVIRAYRLSTKGLYHMRFEPNLTKHDAVTISEGERGRQSRILFGPASFEGGFEWLVHIVAHELEHVRQELIGGYAEGPDPVSEFLAYAGAVLQAGSTAGTPGKGFLSSLGAAETLPGLPALPAALLASQAQRALQNWRKMSSAQHRKYWDEFQGVRDKLLERITKEAPAALRPPNADRLSPEFRSWREGKPPGSDDPFSPEYQEWILAARSAWSAVREQWKQFDAWVKP